MHHFHVGKCQEQWVSIKQHGEFSLQIDKSTNIRAQLLIYVCCLGENNVEEDFLVCRTLKTTTQGEGIFALVDSFMKKERLSWMLQPCLRFLRGFTAQVKEFNSTIMITHCFVHQKIYDLASF